MDWRSVDEEGLVLRLRSRRKSGLEIGEWEKGRRESSGAGGASETQNPTLHDPDASTGVTVGATPIKPPVQRKKGTYRLRCGAHSQRSSHITAGPLSPHNSKNGIPID